MRLTVIGCGYLGAVHAAAMADLGHHVLGVETDPARLERLVRGEAPCYEPGSGPGSRCRGGSPRALPVRAVRFNGRSARPAKGRRSSLRPVQAV